MPYQTEDWHNPRKDKLHTDTIREPYTPKDKLKAMGKKPTWHTFGTFTPSPSKKRKKKSFEDINAKKIWEEMGLKVKYLKPLDLFDTSTLHNKITKNKYGEKVVLIVGRHKDTGKEMVLARIEKYDPNKKRERKKNKYKHINNYVRAQLLKKLRR